LSEATSGPGGKKPEQRNVRFVREMRNALMRVDGNESLDSAKSTEAETAKKAAEPFALLDATTSEPNMLATAS